MADPDIQKNVIKHAQSDMAADPAMSHGKAKQAAPARPQGRKIGAEHLKGMVKLGFHELAHALEALPDSNLKPSEEPGVFGNETMPHLTDRESDYSKSLQRYASRFKPDKDQSPSL